MRLICPACRKPNDVTDAQAVCQRCGCELGPLVAVSQAAQAHLDAAARALRQRRWAEALDHATRAWSLRQSRDAARLAGLAAGGLGGAALLDQWRRRAGRAEG